MIRRRRRYVLVVEDTTSVAKLLQVLLERPDLKIALAPDVASALALLEASEARPDAIVLDHRLPGETGVDVAAAAQQLDVPVVVVSAFITDSMEVDYRALGVSDFLSKPFSINELLATVDRLTLKAR